MKNVLYLLTFIFYFLICILPLFTSCTTDSYETGQGDYSLMQGDFAELTVNGELRGTAFLTDEGEQFMFTTPVTASWIQRPDTVYRAIIYYNKVDATHAEALALGTMPTLRPVEHWRFQEQPTDPIGLESAWLSRSGKYLNLGLLLKNGRVDDEEGAHGIAVACDTILTHADQTRTAYYRLLHDQGDAPEYYTNRRYVSILLPQDRPDTIRLAVPTYTGTVERSFFLRN